MSPQSVLLVGGDADAVERIRTALADPSGTYALAWVQTLGEGVRALAGGDVRCVLGDLGPAGSDGLDVVHALISAASPRSVPVIIISSRDDDREAVEAVGLGAQDQIALRDLHPGVLARAVRHAIERSRIRAELITRDVRWATLVGALTEGVLVQDGQGLVLEANPAAAEILGIPMAKLVTDPPSPLRWRGALGADERPFPVDEAPGRRALRTGQAQRGVIVGFVAPGGIRRWIEIDAAPVPNSLADLGRSVVISFRDISERREREAELIVQSAERVEQARRLAQAERLAERRSLQREVAEHANRTKNDFLSRMSHELRTPLNAVIGFSQLLLREPLAERDAESVNQIHRAGLHLLDLINEVLDISRIEAGALPISIEPVQLLEVIDASVDLIRPSASDRSITIVNRFADADVAISADRQRCLQILLNLLSNAVKYNAIGGGVEISVSRPATDRVRILVTDSGPGIAEADQERVFVPFERLGAERTEVEGTGVGLALSRALAEQMGGLLGVDSTPGSGSTFWCELRLAESGVADVRTPELEPPASRTYPAAQAPPILSRPLVVLSIEDNLASRHLVQRALEANERLTILSAMQGRLGLELARQHQPDLVLLDLHLPDIGGADVLTELRLDPRTASIAVAIVSADATARSRQRLLARGATYYLTKPLDLARLAAIVAEVGSRPRAV